VKRLLVLVAASASALVAVVPAWAAKPAHPVHPTHPSHPSHPSSGSHSKGSCKTLSQGYRASGTLVNATLTPGTKEDHFDGSVSVDVTRANHKAPKGGQTFMLNDVRVRFGKGVTSTTTTAGDQVTLHGKMTAQKHGCSSSGFTPAITVRNVRISAPKQ
jgi:hypothetical protein